MKKSIAILFALLSFIFTTNSQTLNQSVFIDFGLNYSTNGIITASPDVNGNFWNNHTSVAVGAITILKNQAGTASGFTITNVTTFGANGGTAYGGLMAPTAALLGDFAIASATQDYFFLSTANTTYTLKISGLNVSKGYKFYVFGSRENATSRISKYVFTGSTSVTGTLPTSGSNLSGTGYNGNNSTIFTTSILTPNASGEVTFDLSIVSGGFAYINVMKIAEYTIDLNFDKVTSVTVSGADISTDGGNSQMTSVVLPEVAAVKEVTWTVSDPSIATINAFGLLTAKKNGTVNVTATSNEPACTINGSASIKITNQLVANQRVFVDFGPNDTINGNITLSPDINLNYWNNVTDGTITAPEVNLVNSSNNTTGFSLQITSPFSKNGILNGGLLAPNVNYLGEFAIPTVTQDYFFVEPAMTGSFKLKGLNKAKGYKISIFNSRTAVNPARISKFQITGTSLFEGILQSSGTNLGGPNINTNNSTIFTKSIIYPDDNGEILVTLTIESGSFAYINGMILEEYEAKLIAVDSLTVNGNDILIHEATSQMSVVFSPSNATIQPVVWSVDNESFASINFDGLLTPKRNGKVLVTASLTQNGVKITSSKQISVKNQISSLYISGTATVNGDNLAEALLMNIAPASTTTTDKIFELETTLNEGGTLRFYSERNIDEAGIVGLGSGVGTLDFNGPEIVPANFGEVLIRVDLNTKTYRIYPVNLFKISQMGSSVSLGSGATSSQGYAYLYNLILRKRYTDNVGLNWTTSNISVGGNSTISVLNRWEADLLNDNSKYVIYGLSLGNEGIVQYGQSVFDGFKKNMFWLIEKARSAGKIPIVTNNYTRTDFTDVEYTFIKKMNLLIHEWDVPTINFLGAIDNGTGNWAVGYNYDTHHPNDAGHLELAAAFVPSLFDALYAGKPLPSMVNGTSISMGKLISNEQLAFTPENTIHSFTVTIDVKTSSNGVIASFKTGSGLGTIRIVSSTGVLSYTSPNGGIIVGTQIVNDNQWHKITLTHFYARGETKLYSDNNEAGKVSEKLLATQFYLNDITAPETIEYRHWFFYRSGMNIEEVTAMNSGKMLKSSLELYAPLDEHAVIGNDTLVNLAQSMNKIQRFKLKTAINQLSDNSKIKVYANTTNDRLIVTGLNSSEKYSCDVYSMDGRMVIKTVNLNNGELDISDLQTNNYVLVLNEKSSSEQFTTTFQKLSNK